MHHIAFIIIQFLLSPIIQTNHNLILTFNLSLLQINQKEITCKEILAIFQIKLV